LELSAATGGAAAAVVLVIPRRERLRVEARLVRKTRRDRAAGGGRSAHEEHVAEETAHGTDLR
jgi:hypothetical protein